MQLEEETALGCFTHRTLDDIGERPPVGSHLDATLDTVIKHKQILYLGGKRSIRAGIEFQLTLGGTPFGQAVETSIKSGGLDQNAGKVELIVNVDWQPIRGGEQLALAFERSLDSL